MANTGNSDKWYFTKEQLENTPSRKAGYDALKELSYRQQAANFIQDMGQRLKVSQLCINTAIVYMHRFYVFHSFTNFPWHQIAAAALFLAAKVEEQPRKLEYVIRVANLCRNPRDNNIDINSDRYIAQAQDLVFNENVLLQTLGFDVAIDHPHTHVVRCCHLVRASKDLAQTSYFMASNSLHLTTMCIQYKPTVVACFCILVACKWSNWEIPLSNEKKEWFTYVDATVTAELLQQLTNEFLTIFENCPSRLKEKIMAISDNSHLTSSSHSSSPFDQDPKKIKEDGKDHSHRSHDKSGAEDPHKHRSSRPHDAGSSSQPTREQREREYKERKERERLAAQKGLISGSHSKPVPHGHHRQPIDPKLKQPQSKPSSGYPPVSGRVEPRDILREASRDSPFGLANKDFHSKDPQLVRSDKEVQKRDYLLKPNVQTELNSINNYPDARSCYSSDKQRIDPNKSRSSDSKSLSKHDSVRRHEEQKPYLKQETDNIKKHLSASFHDKSNSAYLKSSNTTSQKVKSPYTTDASKSVPKPNNQPAAVSKLHQHNGSSNNYSLLDDTKIKLESVAIKEEIRTPPVVKRSLFSPDQSPPQKKPIKMEPITPSISSDLMPLSPLSSPMNRTRNYSTSSSEPELRPVMKKIDQVEGFENLMRDSTIGVNSLQSVPDHSNLEMIKQEPQVSVPIKSEPAPIDNKSSIVNGLETNPTIISNLLKEAPTVPHLPSVAEAEAAQAAESCQSRPEQSLIELPQKESKEKEKEHHHHKSKKKKEKHKHKDKDKNREEKEKKKRHKDKDRESHKHKEKHSEPPVEHPVISEPIKIKIQKDKIQPLPDVPTVQSSPIGLKIKIPKDKIRTDNIGEPSLPPPLSGGLKIKIPKEVINNCAPHETSSTSSSSKKRERDRNSTGDAPPSKVPKSSYRDSKQNGRHSFNKVAQSGDGEQTVHGLLESKYTKSS